jgi:hypothetical protein
MGEAGFFEKMAFDAAIPTNGATDRLNIAS